MASTIAIMMGLNELVVIAFSSSCDGRRCTKARREGKADSHADGFEWRTKGGRAAAPAPRQEEVRRAGAR